MNVNIITNRTWPYMELMKKFTKTQEKKCNTLSYNTQKVLHPMKQLPTGSKYEGFRDLLGMNGIGRYTFPNGVIYEGEFEDGLFHGRGELQYPDGEILMCRFRRGRVVERILKFADGLFYSDSDWAYCKMPDRRFTIEYSKGVQPAGQSYITAEQPTRKIPEGCCDTGDGFYDPKTKTVYTNESLTTIKRTLSVREQKWTEDNCRVDKIDQGPRKELYEEWLEPELPRPMSRHMLDMTSLSTVDFSVSAWSWVCDQQFSSHLSL